MPFLQLNWVILLKDRCIRKFRSETIASFHTVMKNRVAVDWSSLYVIAAPVVLDANIPMAICKPGRPNNKFSPSSCLSSWSEKNSITSTGCSKSCSQYPRPSPDSFGASLSGSHSVLKKVMHAAWLIPSQLNLLVSSVKLGSTYILAEQGFASVWNSVVSVKTHDDSCLKNFYINPLTDYLKQKLSVQNVLHFCSWINNRETAN